MLPRILTTILVYYYILGGLIHSVGANYGRKQVSTSFGVVRGETVNPEVDDLPAVTQFLGIPYGVAPTGQYRFNMAISAAKWTHQPKDAFTLSNVCIQSGLPKLSETEALKSMSAQRFDHIHRILPFLKPQSEDCLYMNLFVPERLDRHKTPYSQQLSVLVLIHGDDYGWGSGNAFNASILSAYGQVIVVTLNYRLGVYGFMARCEQNSCNGNSGLSDIVAALKMLSNILPSFGGDPTSVTLMGWGSGASLVSLLMASPITQPKNRLFRRAILLDGTALAPWALSMHPQQYFMKVAEALDCYSAGKGTSEEKARNDVFNKDIANIVRCVQDHSEKNLTLAAKKLHAPTFLSAFAPIIDGQIVPNHPRFSFSPKFGALFRDVDLLVGTVNYPAHYLLPNADLEHGIDKEKRDKVIRTLVRNLFDFHRKEIFDATVAEYTDWDNPKHHSKTVRNGLLAALGDVLYTSPLIETARMHSTDEVPRVSNTFFFVFGHETRAWTKEQPSSGIRGSLTEDHLPYIMGFPLAGRIKEEQLYLGFTNDDKNIARVMMHYVSNFVKSGDPSKPLQLSTQTTIEDRFHSTAWPQFNQASREAYLEITDRPRVKNYYRNSFIGFWSSFIPQLNKGTRDSSVVEEHNFLPDYFNRQSFFGYVRPYSALHNDPFPPPPMPPTPIPKDLKKPATTTPPKSTAKPATDSKELEELKAKYSKAQSESYSNLLVIVVVIGIAMLVLNILVSAAFVRICKKGRGEKKTPKYQSYAATGHLPSADLNYIPNSPLSQQLLPPPPPPLGHSTLDRQAMLSASQRPSLAGINPSTKSFGTYEPSGVVTTRATSLPHHILSTSLNNGSISFDHHHPHQTFPRKSIQEQEPLLTNSKSSTPAMMRPPGVSPTCPRHGRAAQAQQMMIAQQSRANSIGSALTLGTNMGPTLEEVQV